MIVIFLSASFICMTLSELVVETSSGPIQSVAALTDDVEAFLGIPYAEPPVGDLRFSRPFPKRSWTEVYKASNLPPPCIQFTEGEDYIMPDITNMTEDCLYLNIWMPKVDYGHRLRPVLFYVHPGGFSSGSSNLKAHDGSRLASRGDVVVVTINYRLGALGYLVAFIEEANGNMGIYDQLMALKWVKDNAKIFGGDPDNIVLVGASAGAISISLHVLSPFTRDLFKRAIIQSGSAVHPFSKDDNRVFRNSEALAVAVGCSNKTSSLISDPHAVVKCLKERPAKDFPEVEYTFLQSAKPFMFAPGVKDAFLPMTSLEVLRRGMTKKGIQMLIGINKNEGSTFLAGLLSKLPGKRKTHSINKNLAVILGITIAQSLGQPRANELVKMYMKNAKHCTSGEYSQLLSDIIGDCLIACSTIFFADFISLYSKNVYFYKFEYRSPTTPHEEWMGTQHLDEIQYVFGNPYHENFTEEEIEMSNKLMDRWSAFAKTGNPNIPDHLPWLPYSYRRPLYMSIDKEDSIRKKPLSRCELWRKRFDAEIDDHLLATDVNQDSAPYSFFINEKELITI